MMNAPAATCPSSRRLLPALESPTIIPLAHDGHDRDPHGRRRGRRLGPAPAPQGRRRVRHPRPAHREDRPVTHRPARPRRAAVRLRRLDLAAVAAGDRRRPSPHRRALVRRGAVPDPADPRVRARATLADVRERGDAAVRDANARVGGGRADGRLVRRAAELRAARDGLAPADCARPSTRPSTTSRRFAETQRPTSTRTEIAPGIEIERRWDAARQRRLPTSRAAPRRTRARWS